MALTKRQKEVMEMFNQGGIALVVLDTRKMSAYYIMSRRGKPNKTIHARTLLGLYREGLIMLDDRGNYVKRNE